MNDFIFEMSKFLNNPCLSILLQSVHNNSVLFFQVGAMFFVVLGWMVKNIIYLTINCIKSEKFYITIENTEDACLQLMKNPKCSSKWHFIIKRK